MIYYKDKVSKSPPFPFDLNDISYSDYYVRIGILYRPKLITFVWILHEKHLYNLLRRISEGYSIYETDWVPYSDEKEETGLLVISGLFTRLLYEKVTWPMTSSWLTYRTSSKFFTLQNGSHVPRWKDTFWSLSYFFNFF